jgi:hypothetical protein
MSRRSRLLAIPRVQPAPRPFPSGRYARMNPLLRWCSLNLLAEPLPAPLRASLIRAWQHPGRFNGNQAIQSQERQHLPADRFPLLPPARLAWMAFMELGVSRRVVEIPRTEISQERRSALLRSQGAYLRSIYDALVAQLGEAATLAEFERQISIS